MAEARKRPELNGVMTTAFLEYRRVGITVDQEKVLTQQVNLEASTRPCRRLWADRW